MKVDNIDINRFMMNIPFRESKDSCWLWAGSLDSKGYGDYNHRRAHRVMYWIVNGDFDDTLEVMHICDNPQCVNPSHLKLGTHSDNISDMVRKNRNNSYNKALSYCKHGHEFTESNTYYYKGRRQCRACKHYFRTTPPILRQTTFGK